MSTTLANSQSSTLHSIHRAPLISIINKQGSGNDSLKKKEALGVNDHDMSEKENSRPFESNIADGLDLKTVTTSSYSITTTTTTTATTTSSNSNNASPVRAVLYQQSTGNDSCDLNSIPASDLNSTNEANQHNVKSKKKVQFISDDQLDNPVYKDRQTETAMAATTRPIRPMSTNFFYSNTLASGNPSSSSYRSSFNTSHYHNGLSSHNGNNRHNYNSFRKSYTLMPSSTTMPSISSILSQTSSTTGAAVSGNKRSAYQPVHYHSFNLESLDNPFRPEGQLAKEADEFVKQLKIKEEQKVQEIIQTSLNNSINTTSAASPSKSINIELSGVNVSVSNANTPAKHNTNNNVSSPTKSPATNNVNSPSSPKNTNATPSKPAAAQDNNSSKKDDKKKKKSSDDKTKPKCGCTIS